MAREQAAGNAVVHTSERCGASPTSAILFGLVWQRIALVPTEQGPLGLRLRRVRHARWSKRISERAGSQGDARGRSSEATAGEGGDVQGRKNRKVVGAFELGDGSSESLEAAWGVVGSVAVRRANAQLQSTMAPALWSHPSTNPALASRPLALVQEFVPPLPPASRTTPNTNAAPTTTAASAYRPRFLHRLHPGRGNRVLPPEVPSHLMFGTSATRLSKPCAPRQERRHQRETALRSPWRSRGRAAAGLQ